MPPCQNTASAARGRGFSVGPHRHLTAFSVAVLVIIGLLPGRLSAQFGEPEEPQPWTKTSLLEDIDLNGDGIRDFQLLFLQHWPGDYQSYDWIAFRLAPTRGNSVIMNVKTRTDGSTYRDSPVLLPDRFEVAAQLPPTVAWESEERSLLSFDDPWSLTEPLSNFKGPLHEADKGMLGLQFQAGDGAHYGWVELEREDLDKYPWFKIHIREVGFHPEPDEPLIVGTHPPRPDDLPEVESVDLNGDMAVDVGVLRRIEPNVDGSAAFWRIWLDGPSLEVLTEESGEEITVVGLPAGRPQPWSQSPGQGWRPLGARPLLLSGWRETGETGGGEGSAPGLMEGNPTLGPLAEGGGAYVGLRDVRSGHMAWVQVDGEGKVTGSAWLGKGAGVTGEPACRKGFWIEEQLAVLDMDHDGLVDVVLRRERNEGMADGRWWDLRLVMLVLVGNLQVVSTSWAEPVSFEPGQVLRETLPEGLRWQESVPAEVLGDYSSAIWDNGGWAGSGYTDGLAKVGPAFIGLRFPVGEQWRYGWIQVARDGILDYGMAADLDTPMEVGTHPTSDAVHLEIERDGDEVRITWDPLYRWFDLESSTGLETDSAWLPLVRADATTGLSVGEYRASASSTSPRFYRLRQN